MIHPVDGGAGSRGAADSGSAVAGWQSKEQFSELVSELEQRVRSSHSSVVQSEVRGWAVFADSVAAPAGTAAAERSADLSVGAPRPDAESTRQWQGRTATGPSAQPPAAAACGAASGASAAPGGPARATTSGSLHETGVALRLSPQGSSFAANPIEASDAPDAISALRPREARVRAAEHRPIAAVAHRDAGHVDVAVRLFRPTVAETHELQQRLHEELGRLGLSKYRLWVNGAEIVNAVQSEEDHGH
jgi:hypothetical protein